jgi:hypothetical protein
VDEAVVLDNSGLHPVRMLLFKAGARKHCRNGFSGWPPCIIEAFAQLAIWRGRRCRPAHFAQWPMSLSFRELSRS